VRAGARPSDDVLLADAQFRGALRRQLITGIVHGGDPPAGTNATVTVGPHTVHFRTDLGLMRQGRDSEWQRLVSASVAPASVTSPRLLGRILLRMASEILRTGGTASTATMRTAVQRIIAQDAPVAGQGIVVGGELAAEARVSGNTVLDVVQGVHVGLAAKGSPPASSRSAGVVSIEDNNVRVSLPSSTSRARHGIYCGSVDSLVIDSNRITLSRNGRNIGLRTEAIRLFGTFGRRVIVRHNHMGAQGTASQFTVGVTFAPLNTPLPAQPMWIVTENEMESSTNKVDVPAGGPRAPGPADPNGVRSRIRGLADNFS
jgi:hypothetical protein